MYTIEIQMRNEHGEVVGQPVTIAQKHSQLSAMEFMMSVVDASLQLNYWCVPLRVEDTPVFAGAVALLPVVGGDYERATDFI